MLMKRQRLPLHALRAFEAAARQSNLVRAAEELGVTHSAVSHQLRKLEESLNARLFDRRHKPLRLTQEGEQFLVAVTDAFDRLSRAAGEIQGGVFEGDLTVSCVPGLGANWLVPILGEFLSTYARVRIRIVTEYWHHPSEAEDADLAIAYGSAEHPGKRVVLLGHSEFFPVCSPRLVSDPRSIRDPSDLLGFNLLHEHSDETWSRWFIAAGVDDIGVSRGIFFDSAHLSLQAARAGYGVAMGDTPTVYGDLKEGRLIRLFAEAVPAIHPYYVITPALERMKPAAQTLEAWIIERFRALKGDDVPVAEKDRA